MIWLYNTDYGHRTLTLLLVRYESFFLLNLVNMSIFVWLLCNGSVTGFKTSDN